jgi:elongation factor G
MFLNKLDRPGASFRSSLLSLLAHRFHPSPTALTLPIASFDPEAYLRGEPGVEGLVDLVKWELWKWDKEGNATRHSLPTKTEELANSGLLPPSHPLIPHLVPARINLLENLSMHSEELMESLLNLESDPSAYLNVGSSFVMPHLRRAVLQNKILPVLCGSAIKNIGTELVMDYVGELFANPLDFKTKSESPDGPLRLLAWKVVWDKRRGWMTFVRVYSGVCLHHATESINFDDFITRHIKATGQSLQSYAKREREGVKTSITFC